MTKQECKHCIYVDFKEMDNNNPPRCVLKDIDIEDIQKQYCIIEE